MTRETIIRKLNTEELDVDILIEAGKKLAKGELVAFPTETVYGLGADGLNESAVKNIFVAKGRPQDNPLILHISSIDMLDELVEKVSKDALKLIDAFWPGPLTLIFKKSELVPDIITGGLDTVAIRMPDNKIALELISNANTPISAPSANTSGRPSPTAANHVLKDLEGKIDMILDGGSTGIGLESTVIDMSEDTPTILRPGGVTLEKIQDILPDAVEDRGILDNNENLVPKSPGQKYKHYAPNKNMILFVGDNDFVVRSIQESIERYKLDNKRVGVIGTDENLNKYKADELMSLGSMKDKESIAHNLFDVYRSFDDKDVDIILSESVENKGLGKAILNRMKKACGGNIVKED